MEDRFVKALDALDAGRRRLMTVLAAQGKAIAQFRRTRLRGSPVSTIMGSPGWREAHERATTAVSGFVSALARMRAIAVWTIAEEEGATLSHIARLTGNARQVVSRLYQAARDEVASHRRGGPPPSREH